MTTKYCPITHSAVYWPLIDSRDEFCPIWVPALFWPLFDSRDEYCPERDISLSGTVVFWPL